MSSGHHEAASAAASDGFGSPDAGSRIGIAAVSHEFRRAGMVTHALDTVSLDVATGEFIAIVNSDDPVLPGFISTTVEYMQTHPELLATYPDWNWIDEDSRFIRHERSRDYSYTEMLR